MSLAISPYLEIEDEVRVVLLDETPLVVYSKSRPAVEGDGRHSLFELALDGHTGRAALDRAARLAHEFDKAELDAILPPGNGAS